MKVGILKDYDEKEVKKTEKAGKQVFLGIELNSLYDELNIMEVQHNHNPALVLTDLKLQVMKLLGKVTVQQEGDDNAG